MIHKVLSTYGLQSLWENELSRFLPFSTALRHTPRMRVLNDRCIKIYTNVILRSGRACAPLVSRSAHPTPFILNQVTGSVGGGRTVGQVRLKLPYPVDPAHPLSGPAITGVPRCWDQTLDVLEGWLVTSSVITILSIA